MLYSDAAASLLARSFRDAVKRGRVQQEKLNRAANANLHRQQLAAATWDGTMYLP